MTSKIFASNDGSPSAFNEEFGECYSSLSEGALSEKIAKHIAPAFEYLRSKIFKHSQAKIHHNAQSDVWILDICFGLGYNAFLSASAFEYLLAQNPLAKNLHIISLEKDRATLDLARQIWHLDNDKWQSLASGQTTRLSQNASLTIIWGDASKVLENLAQDFATKDFSQDFAGDFVDDFAVDFTQYFTEVFARGFAGFDIIYQDPFSFGKNPALWSEEHFKCLFAISKSTSLITSYATRKEVLANAQKAGFLAHKLRGDFCHFHQEILQDMLQAILPFLKHTSKGEHTIKSAVKSSSEAKSPLKHQAKSQAKPQTRESSLFSKQEICLPNVQNHAKHTKSH